MTDTTTILGGSIASLVAADELSRAGRPVRLLLPRKGVGGGFAPLAKDGRPLERGLRSFELGFEDEGAPPPLEDYVPSEVGHRPYIGLVRAWVEQLAGDELVPLPEPAMLFEGRLRPELHLRVDLRGVDGMLNGRSARVAAEAGAARELLGDGGGLLDDPEALWATTFTDASRRQHGDTFHDTLIAPLVAKIRPTGGDDVPATLRRKVWMPLFWPGTLARAAAGEDPGFAPHRPFSTLRGGTGRIVELLQERLEAAPQVTIERYDALSGIDGAPGRVTVVTLDGLGEVVAPDLVLGVPAKELHAATGIAHDVPRASSVLQWVAAAEDDLLAAPGFVHVVDADVPAFRISYGTATDLGRTICVELSHDVERERALGAARRSLEACGLLREGAPLHDLAFFRGPTYAEPTAAAYVAFETARGAFRARGIAGDVVGGSDGFGSDAFSEQVVQGLLAAARRG